MLVWSSTWVVIAVGLEDIAPFFGAGIRFALAGVGVLVAAALLRRPLRTDVAARGARRRAPFATSYGLIYWAEQYVTSGLAAVLFGVLPLYVALLAAVLLPAEPLRPRLLVGVGIAFGGLVLAFGESLDLGPASTRRWRRCAVVLAPLASAIGNVAIKLRGATVDPLVMNGWAMLIGGVAAARRLRADRGLGRDGRGRSASIGSILYLAAFGTGFTFVTLTVLLRELPAVTVSFISMIIPFGALALGRAVPRRAGDRAGRGRRAARGRRDRRRAVPAAPSATMTACLRSSSSAPAISAARSSATTSTNGWRGAAVARSPETLETVRAAGGLPLQADASDPDAAAGRARAGASRVRPARPDRQRGQRRGPDRGRPFGGGALREADGGGLRRLDRRGRAAGVRVPQRGRARRARAR